MMRRRCLTFTIFLAVIFLTIRPQGTNAQPDTGRRLVLAASARSTVTELSPAEVRKLFLGIVIEQNGKPLAALRNQTDSVLHEVFLQKVMFMSGPMYERTLLTRLLRTKGARPEEYRDEQALRNALLDNPHAVTYMWSSQVDDSRDLRTVVELWHE